MNTNEYLSQVEEDMIAATEDELREEATRRLRMIVNAYGLRETVLEKWEQGVVSCSSETVHGIVATAKHTKHYDLTSDAEPAILLEVPKNSQLAEIICEFEEEYGCVVYYVVQNAFFLTMLFVSPYMKDWETLEKPNLSEGCFEAYVHYLLRPWDSEVGKVKLCSLNGVLIRII